jgi:8-oxo-dGTP pyrophosphatase MutT (NUDIX family)
LAKKIRAIKYDMLKKYPPQLAHVASRLQSALLKRPVYLADTRFTTRPASVFFPLCWHDSQVHVLFTKRTSKLSNHSGQISFPGGSQDKTDPGPGYAALRETCEEIGVKCEQMKILARLDQTTTITGFCITPFLGIIEPGSQYVVNHHEVERLIMVPLVKVLNISNYQEEEIIWEDSPTYWIALKHGNDVIWGATARIMLSFIGALQDVGVDYKIAVDI